MSEIITLYNQSKQAIPIHVRPPGGEFYQSEQQVTIRPSKSISLIKEHVNMDQVNNLQRRGMLKIIK